ncbi:alpha/beta fold hydrolase [Actinomycetes bacterium KLBMP 9759]
MEDGPELQYTRTSDGVHIAYQVLGSGPALVWLPSLGNLLAQWRVPELRAAYLELSRSVRLVLYDARGMGSSDRRVDLRDLGLDAHTRDLEAVVDAVGLDTTSLLGYYHSSTTAMAFAAEHPHRVERMVLFGAAARMRDMVAAVENQALFSLLDQDWDLFVDTAAHAWMGWTAGESGRLMAESFRTAVAPAVAKAWLEAALDVDVTALLRDVLAPTLVIHRQGERQIPVEVSRRLADALPRGELVELDGSSPTLLLGEARTDVGLLARYVTAGKVSRPAAAPSPPGERVTPRELDVLRLLAAGDSNTEIARTLGITVHTVERHTTNLYRKIGARGRADAAAYALRRGLA